MVADTHHLSWNFVRERGPLSARHGLDAFLWPELCLLHFQPACESQIDRKPDQLRDRWSCTSRR